MNDTTVRYPAGLADCVPAYVREVRAELADLPLEDVDDLTGGMEADLSELAAESGGDLIGRLGSPRLYAAELRSAAGLPERVAGPGPGRRPVSDALTHARSSFAMLTDQHPGLRSVTAFLVSLRPAWWVLRGYLAAWALWSFVMGMQGIGPHGILQFAVAVVAIVVSVRLGRGWLRHMVMTRPLLVLGNTIAVVVALMASTAGVTSGEMNYDAQAYGPPAGVALDGAQVLNIYAYDSDGNRITGVRLFAQDGRPLNGAQSSVDANGSQVSVDVNGSPMVVVRDTSGAPLTNVYPQRMFGPDPWQVTDPNYSEGNPLPWSPPMSISPLIPSSTPTVTSTPTATQTATPTATPTAPKKSVSPTPPSGPSPSVTRSGR